MSPDRRRKVLLPAFQPPDAPVTEREPTDAERCPNRWDLCPDIRCVRPIHMHGDGMCHATGRHPRYWSAFWEHDE